MTLLHAVSGLAEPVKCSFLKQVRVPEGLRPPLAEVQWIQTALWERHRVRTLRASLADFEPRGRGRLDADSGTLTLDGVSSSTASWCWLKVSLLQA